MVFDHPTLSRAAGLANLIAGLATAAYWFIHPGLDNPQNALLGSWAVMNSVFIGLLVFLMWGLCGLYFCQSEKVGWLGFLGFALSFAGTAMFIGAGAFDAFVTPILTTTNQALLGAQGTLLTGGLGKYFMTTGMVFALGYLIFGIASFRAGVLPRWPALLMALSAPILGTSPLHTSLVRIVGCLIYGLANAALGLWLFRRRAD